MIEDLLFGSVLALLVGVFLLFFVSSATPVAATLIVISFGLGFGTGGLICSRRFRCESICEDGHLPHGD